MHSVARAGTDLDDDRVNACPVRSLSCGNEDARLLRQTIVRHQFSVQIGNLALVLKLESSELHRTVESMVSTFYVSRLETKMLWLTTSRPSSGAVDV